METIYSRRAVREFTAEPIDDNVLRQLIDAAIQAPSAVNEQPWLFSVVLDKTLLARISREAKAHLLKTTALGLLSHSPRLQQILNDPSFDIFYRAPALIVISSVTKGTWDVENCTLAAENLIVPLFETEVRDVPTLQRLCDAIFAAGGEKPPVPASAAPSQQVGARP